MANDDDYAYDLQPADDIDSGDLDIVVRSLNFGKSAKYSPSLVIISAEESVSFRVLYGWDDDNFDDTVSTELIGRTCRVSGIEPKHLTDFSAWLRNTSGASANSTATCLPQPICPSAQSMWESLCELKRQFATDAFFLPKEIRRRVEAWEVVNWHLDEFFMETEPSEEDKASVFGSMGPASGELTNTQCRYPVFVEFTFCAVNVDSIDCCSGSFYFVAQRGSHRFRAVSLSRYRLQQFNGHFVEPSFVVPSTKDGVG